MERFILQEFLIQYKEYNPLNRGDFFIYNSHNRIIQIRR